MEISAVELYTVKAPNRPVQRIVTLDLNDDGDFADVVEDGSERNGTAGQTILLKTVGDWLGAVKKGLIPWGFVRENEDNIVGVPPTNVSQEDFETILELAVNSQGGACFK